MPPLAEWIRALGRYCAMAWHGLAAFIGGIVTAIRPYPHESRTASAESQAHDDGMRRVYRIRRVAVLCLIVAVTVSALVGVNVLVRNAKVANVNAGPREKAVATSSKTTSGRHGALVRQAAPAAQTQAVLTDGQRAAIASKAQTVAEASGKTLHRYRYCISTKGDVGEVGMFESVVFRTLNSSLGWPRAGATFSYVDSGCDMTLILAAADAMTSFSEGCSEEYSCRVDDNVIINMDRWQNGTKGWLKAGGTVERYRRLVINHEVGHRLGHLDNEATCSVAGGAAPVMQQQSMSLGDCSANEWPLDSELWIS